MLGTDAEGVISFTVDFKDLAENSGAQADQDDTTGPTSVTYDRTAPLVSVLTIASDNVDTAWATVGDVVTITFTANEDINGPLAADVEFFTNTADSLTPVSTDGFTATRTMLTGDPEVAIAFTIDYKDLAENPATTATQAAITTAPNVTFDETAPTLTGPNVFVNPQIFADVDTDDFRLEATSENGVIGFYEVFGTDNHAITTFQCSPTGNSLTAQQQTNTVVGFQSGRTSVTLNNEILLDYTGKTSDFNPDSTVTGQTTGASAKIVSVNDNGDGTGTLTLSDLSPGAGNVLFDGVETIVDDGGTSGSATADGKIDGGENFEFDEAGFEFTTETHSYDCSATDPAGNESPNPSTISFNLIVEDTTPPNLNLPNTILFDTAVISLNGEADGSMLTVDRTGSVSIGEDSPVDSAVWTGVEGTESAGRDGKIIVAGDDTVRLVSLSCDGPEFTTETTGNTDTDITITSPKLDGSEGDPQTFPLNADGSNLTTNFTCTSTDAAGLQTSAQVSVQIVDSTPPTVFPPTDITVDDVIEFRFADPNPETTTGIVTKTFGPTVAMGQSASTQYAIDATDNTGVFAKYTARAFDLVAIDAAASFKCTPNNGVAQITMAVDAPAHQGGELGVITNDVIPTGQKWPIDSVSSTYPPKTTTIDCFASDPNGNTDGTATGGVQQSFEITAQDTRPAIVMAQRDVSKVVTGVWTPHDLDSRGFEDDTDVDLDTWFDDLDCDDNNATVFPGAPELADNLDNDCDGFIDEAAATTDGDGDTWFDDVDCNDGDVTVFPGATEIADGKDNDCDARIDDLPLDVLAALEPTFERVIAVDLVASWGDGLLVSDDRNTVAPVRAECDSPDNCFLSPPKIGFLSFTNIQVPVFTPGTTVSGLTSSAVGTVHDTSFDLPGATSGKVTLSNVQGVFDPNESIVLTPSGDLLATTAGALEAGLTIVTHTVQDRNGGLGETNEQFDIQGASSVPRPLVFGWRQEAILIDPVTGAPFGDFVPNTLLTVAFDTNGLLQPLVIDPRRNDDNTDRQIFDLQLNSLTDDVDNAPGDGIKLQMIETNDKSGVFVRNHENNPDDAETGIPTNAQNIITLQGGKRPNPPVTNDAQNRLKVSLPVDDDCVDEANAATPNSTECEVTGEYDGPDTTASPGPGEAPLGTENPSRPEGFANDAEAYAHTRLVAGGDTGASLSPLPIRMDDDVYNVESSGSLKLTDDFLSGTNAGNTGGFQVINGISDIVAYYKFEGNFEDSSPNLLDGTGSSTFTPGILGQATSVTNVGGAKFVTVSHDSDLDFGTDSFTAMFPLSDRINHPSALARFSAIRENPLTSLQECFSQNVTVNDSSPKLSKGLSVILTNSIFPPSIDMPRSSSPDCRLVWKEPGKLFQFPLTRLAVESSRVPSNSKCILSNKSK